MQDQGIKQGGLATCCIGWTPASAVSSYFGVLGVRVLVFKVLALPEEKGEEEEGLPRGDDSLGGLVTCFAWRARNLLCAR